jgi:hypothetical protein
MVDDPDRSLAELLAWPPPPAMREPAARRRRRWPLPLYATLAVVALILAAAVTPWAVWALLKLLG